MLRCTVLAIVLAGALGAAAGAEPPPHAPAHGYRHKHGDGVELVFDARFGLYRVAEHLHHFFHEGAFFRLHDGRWQRAPRFEGPWEHVKPPRLPGPMERLAEERDLGKGRERGTPKPSHRGPPGRGPSKGPKGRGHGGKGPPGR